MTIWARHPWGAVGLAVALLAPRAAAGGEKIALSVSPPIVEMTAAQGGDRNFAVTLTNDGDKAFVARAQVVDLTLDRNGDPVARPAGTSGWSAAPWVSVSHGEISLRPGERKTVRCRVRIPRGQTGGRYGAVLFCPERGVETRGSPPRSLASGGIRLDTRIGTVLLLTIARTERRRGEVAETEVIREPTGRVLFRAALRNSGNAHFRAAGEVLIRDSADRTVGRLRLSGGTGAVLPDGIRDFVGRWRAPKLQAGSYRAEVRFTAPGLSPVRRITEFNLPSEPGAPDNPREGQQNARGRRMAR